MTHDIPERENLTVEFKSDRDRLSDRDLIAAVICLANTGRARGGMVAPDGNPPQVTQELVDCLLKFLRPVPEFALRDENVPVIDS